MSNQDSHCQVPFQYQRVLFLLIIIEFLCGFVTFGSIRHQELNLKSNQLTLKTEELVPTYETAIIPVPFSRVDPFWALGFKAALAQETNVVFELRSSRDGSEWSTWSKIKEDDLDAKQTKEFFSELIFFEQEIKFIQLRVKAPTALPPELKLFFTFPGKTGAHSLRVSKLAGRPNFVSRKAWGCPQPEHVASRELTQVTHIVLHHSAADTFNKDFAAVVRSYWNYHVNGRQWEDIGYNWLVDGNGVLYKGRAWKSALEENVKGSHNSKQNSNTVGICLIGNYQVHSPSSKGLDKLTTLMAFLSSQYGIDPLAQSYHAAIGRMNNTIAGHQQSGGGTLCPGDNVIGQIYQIRQNTKNKILHFEDVTS